MLVCTLYKIFAATASSDMRNSTPVIRPYKTTFFKISPTLSQIMMQTVQVVVLLQQKTLAYSAWTFPERASKLHTWLFLVASPAVLFCGVYSGSLHPLSLVCLAALPIGIIAGWHLREHHSLDSVGEILKNVVLYGRITGVLFLISLLAVAATNLV